MGLTSMKAAHQGLHSPTQDHQDLHSPSHALSISFLIFSLFSLFSFFYSLVLVMAPGYFLGIDIFSFSVFYMHSIFIFTFIGVYQVWWMDLPHHENQVSPLAMSHSLQIWPFQTTRCQLLYEIFFNLLVFHTNKCCFKICMHSFK